jgi:hypothetical protein
MGPEEEEIRQVLEEAWEEACENTEDPLKDYAYTSFISKSAGKNRKRRRWAEVEFIGLGQGRFVSLIDGRPPKKKKARLDSVAEEALGDNCPPYIHPLDHFIHLLRQRDKRSKYKSRG